MKATALILTILMLAFIQAAEAQEQPQTLTVRVVDPDGLPKPGLTVVVEGPGFRETSATNSSGHAVFRQIVPGSYELVLLLQNIELLRRSISYPETTFLELQAPVSRLSVKVSDLAGRAVENVIVTLNAPTGVVSVSQRTNSTGHAFFSDVPYSTLGRIGGAYSLRVSKQDAVVARSSVDVAAGRVFHEITAGLVNVNFTVVFRDGQEAPVDAEL
ncbi:MAG: carboxypeptidase-like regulatory domain-containing protein, partial [Candidatus Caldarchaeum sp.]